MTNRRLTLEHALYALAFSLALTLRFLHLGALPLSDFEADWAFQALQLARGAHPATPALAAGASVGPNPAYVLLTSIPFYIFGASDFLARFWPALAGSILVLTPFFFRDRLGRIPALILAFALAFEPGLLALSRMAGSLILAVSFLMLAWAMWRDGRYPLAGVLAGLALLSGPALWMGLLALALTWAIGQALDGKWWKTGDHKQTARDGQASAVNRKTSNVNRESSIETGHWSLNTEHWKTALVYLLGTLLLGGSLFLLAPSGLSALVASLLAFVQGWWTPSGERVIHLLNALVAYQLMALIFGILALVRGLLNKDRLVIGLGLWTLVALLLALVYPARQVADLAWALIPLWALAALELSRYTKMEGIGAWELAGVTTLTTSILVFAWMNLAGVTGQEFTSPLAQTRLLLLLGALLLLGLSLTLVGMGWSLDTARQGAVWGSALFLAAFTLGAATGAAGLRRPLTAELWSPAPPWPDRQDRQTAQADLLQKTLDNLSEWNKGHIESLPVMVVGVDSPALRWLLRDWEVKETGALSPADSPALVIAPQGVELNLSAAYRGQDFVWYQSPNWDEARPEEWLRWFVYRQMPQQTESIVLWARNNLFFESGVTP
ncbi:MAG: hypothetical protein KJ606_03915 [Chloroflexi bacterium]|nr:hypothetical protein [Chloroflexota bacterium]